MINVDEAVTYIIVSCDGKSKARSCAVDVTKSAILFRRTQG
jgi:hypothetical protein